MILTNSYSPICLALVVDYEYIERIRREVKYGSTTVCSDGSCLGPKVEKHDLLGEIFQLRIYLQN